MDFHDVVLVTLGILLSLQALQIALDALLEYLVVHPVFSLQGH